MAETNTFEAQAQIKPKRARKTDGVQPDEFCDDGVTRKLNRSLPYGTIYTAALDGEDVELERAKFEQSGVRFGGDGIPINYVPAAKRGVPEVAPPPVEEVLEENEQLRHQVNAQQAQIAELFKAIEELKAEKPPAKPAERSGRAAA